MPFEAILDNGPDPQGARGQAADLAGRGLALTAALAGLLHHGSYVSRLATLGPAGIEAMTNPPPTPEELRQALSRGECAQAIARVRTEQMLRIIAAEVAGAPLESVGEQLWQLVRACAQRALEEHQLAQHVCVLAMGKLAGRELNLLSDVDLMFVHHDDPALEGAHGHGERTKLFAALRKVVALLEGPRSHRPVFRVDLRLRPFGSRGALSLSLSGTEQYYERSGRNWERQALLRCAPLAGAVELGERLLHRLEPFIFRRSVTPAMFEEVEEIMIRALRPPTAQGHGLDLKHTAGGIRSVEFLVQSLQLLNAGRDESLRTPSTLVGLDRLAAAGLLSDREHQVLTEQYRMLRRIEHRVQLNRGVQTHDVPGDGGERAILAARLGYPSLESFDDAVAEGMEAVAQIAETLVAPERRPPRDASALDRAALGAVVRDPTAPTRARVAALKALGLPDAEELGARIEHALSGVGSPFRGSAAARRGGARLLEACLESSDPVSSVARLDAFIRHRPSHHGVWAYLAESASPELVTRMGELLGSSDPISLGLVGFPGAHGLATDESVGLLLELDAAVIPSADERAAELDRRLGVHARQAGAPATGDALDRELLRFKHRELCRVALHDLGQRPSPQDVGEALTSLADQIVGAIAKDLAASRTGPALCLSVLAVGKYGMRAMDYGSDLDLVFVYEGDAQVGPDAIALARALLGRLENRSFGSRLYEVDARLRPSGRQGLLVTSASAFLRYHQKALPVWELLANLRLRPVLDIFVGEPGRPLGARLVTEVVDGIFAREHPPAEVAAAIRRLKPRIERELARESEQVVHVKSGAGGVFELELLVGGLQLMTSTPGLDVHSVLAALAQGSHLPRAQAEQLGESYTFLRRLLNRMRMMHTTGDRDRLALNSPRLAPLARRMGVSDPDVLVRTLRSHTARVRGAFDSLLTIHG